MKKGSTYFTRYGDNDLMMITGRNSSGGQINRGKAYGGNKTVYSEKLSVELKTAFTIKDEGYLKGVSGLWQKEPGMRNGCFAPFPYSGKLIDMIASVTSEQEFLSPVLFQYLFCFQSFIFEQFLEYIKGDVLFVGSVPKSHVEKILKTKVKYVTTPRTGAYKKIKTIWNGVEKNSADIIIPACGQCSRVLAGRLWNSGYNGHVIDMGSIFDVFLMPTRTWLKLEGAKIRARYG